MMIYMTKDDIRDAKRFAQASRMSVSLVAREGIQMRIASAEDPYVGGFNDGLKCAMEAARNTHGGQMMFPSGVTFAVINAPPADQEVPLYSSVQVTFAFVKPPAASPAFCVPAPAGVYLATIKAPPADQEVPLYSSVQAAAAFE